MKICFRFCAIYLKIMGKYSSTLARKFKQRHSLPSGYLVDPARVVLMQQLGGPLVGGGNACLIGVGLLVDPIQLGGLI